MILLKASKLLPKGVLWWILIWLSKPNVLSRWHPRSQFPLKSKPWQSFNHHERGWFIAWRLWQLNEKLLARMGKVTTIISSAADAIATELYAETLSEQSVAKQSRILRLAVIADVAMEKAKRWIFVSAAAGDEFCWLFCCKRWMNLLATLKISTKCSMIWGWMKFS